MKLIGFVGLGAMGSVMAPLPLKAGYHVIGYDPATNLNENSGVRIASRLIELAKCDAIIFMLPDGAVVTNVAREIMETGFSGLFIDMSSSQPDGTIALGRELGEKELRLIDAPVSGGQKKAALGKLMVMTGGDQINFNSARRLLECFGNVVHVGPLAAGHAMKALNNYVSAAGMLASMQALATAESYGIRSETFSKVINGSTGRNNTTEVKLEPYIIPRQYNSGFSLSLMVKDVSIASQLIKSAGFDTPTTAALNDYFSKAADTLGPNTDHTGIYELVNPAIN